MNIENSPVNWVIRYPLALIIALFLSSICLAEHKDYSDRGGEYELLKGIRLQAVSVEFKDKCTRHFFGDRLECSVFLVRTREVVPFLDHANPYNNVMKDLDFYYEVAVGVDVGSILHNQLIRDINGEIKVLAKKEKITGVGMSGPVDSYLLFKGKAKMPDVVWFDGRFVDVIFKRMSERRKDRTSTTESFWKSKIRFYHGDQRIPIEPMERDAIRKFQTDHKHGKFKKP